MTTVPPPPPVGVIEGHAGRKTNNALTLTFQSGPPGTEPIAVARQGGGDGMKAKAGILFGFKNGGPGHHVLAFAGGRVLNVASRRYRWSTILTDETGREVGTMERGDYSRALDSAGTEILRISPDPEDPKNTDLFKMVVTDPKGELIAFFDIIRTNSGWMSKHLIDIIFDEWVWWDRPGRALPIPFLGSRITMFRALTEQERDALLVASTDIVIGMSVYYEDMGYVPNKGWPPDPDRP